MAKGKPFTSTENDHKKAVAEPLYQLTDSNPLPLSLRKDWTSLTSRSRPFLLRLTTPRPMSLSDRFPGAVKHLVDEGDEAMIRNLAGEIIYRPVIGTTDCTEALKHAFYWGLRKYGQKMLERDTRSFFAMMCQLAANLPTSCGETNNMRLFQVIYRTESLGVIDAAWMLRPSAYLGPEPPPADVTQALESVKEEGRLARIPLPFAVTIQNVGFSHEFAVPMAVVMVPFEAANQLQISNNTLPIVIIPGKFISLSSQQVPQPFTGHQSANHSQRASAIVTGGKIGWEAYQRKNWLSNLPDVVRAKAKPGPILLGESIGLAQGPEEKDLEGSMLPRRRIINPTGKLA